MSASNLDGSVKQASRKALTWSTHGLPEEKPNSLCNWSSPSQADLSVHSFTSIKACLLTRCTGWPFLADVLRIRFVHRVALDYGAAATRNGTAEPSAAEANCIDSFCNKVVNKFPEFSEDATSAVAKNLLIYGISNFLK